ncbi:MAG: LptA/OstA family protein [Nitrospira sp.]|nr:LptA/OstA family protein [Nitrospira sp.]
MKLKRILRQLCGNSCTIVIAACLPFFLSFIAVPVTKGEEVSSTHFISRDQEGALSITSRKMTLKNQENTVLFEGDVVVNRDSSTLTANSVEVIFDPAVKGEGVSELKEKKRYLSIITATGDVKFVQGNRLILAEKVIYYKKEERMVFTGAPNIHEGQDELKGEKITVYLNDDRVIIEGGEAVIHQR